MMNILKICLLYSLVFIHDCYTSQLRLTVEAHNSIDYWPQVVISILNRQLFQCTTTLIYEVGLEQEIRQISEYIKYTRTPTVMYQFNKEQMQPRIKMKDIYKYSKGKNTICI